jgi:threonine synthase
MKLYSTNKKSPEVNFEEAVFKGLPDDNGLYMPVSIPRLPARFFDELENMSFQEMALEVTHELIGDEIGRKDLETIINDSMNFPVEIHQVDDNIFALELFHGPTMAFKDFGARFMSRVMGHFLAKKQKEITILVATSGDTGSAVAHGFLGVPGINVVILYPSGKVSEIQEKQLTTIGQNVTALEIDGTFDDCQRMVKQAFLDKELNKLRHFTSDNSINIARLIPQSFYYHYAWSMLHSEAMPLVFCTPSGNFGNLCGGLIAKKMGLPIDHFVAATNANHIVPDYLLTEKFAPKPSVKTISNAMDVGNPSNFPRVQALYGGSYDKINRDISGAWYTDAQTSAAMKEVFTREEYLLCPHSAIGYLGAKDYLKGHPGKAGVFLATAHPAKFYDVVEKVIGKPVDMPPVLQETMEKSKQAIKMAASDEALKAFLIG